MDHLFQIRSVGAARGADARGHDHARLHGRASRARAAGPDGRRHPLPPPGPVAQGGHDARRARPAAAPGSASARPGTRRSRAAWAFPMPPLADRFELLEDTLRFVRDGWTGEHGTEAAVRGPHGPRDAPAQQPPGAQPAASADPGGRRRRAARRCAWWRATRTRATCSAPRTSCAHKYEVLRGHCEAEGRDYAAIERTNLTWISITPDGARGLADPVRAGGPPRRVGGGRLACTPSSASATCGTCPSWSSSAAMCCPHVRGLGEPQPARLGRSPA